MTSEESSSGPRGIIGYDPSLEAELLQFQLEAYPERRVDLVMPRWKWMFLESAKRLGVDPKVWLYRGKHGISAHQGAIPVMLKVGDSQIVTGWFVETMALESVRGKAIGPMLVQKALEDMPFNLSLGQTAQMREMQFALGWRQVAPLNTFVYPLNPRRVLAGKLGGPIRRLLASQAIRCLQLARKAVGGFRAGPSVTFREVQKFQHQHDELWRRVRDEYPCSVVRDASYMNWKYVEQPGQKFLRLEVLRADELVAIVVIAIKEPDATYQYRRGFLVDLVAPLTDAPLMRSIYHAVCECLKEQNADTVVFHVINRNLEASARAFGFLCRLPTRFLLVATDDVSETTAGQVLSGDGWLITMGDSDIDRPW